MPTPTARGTEIAPTADDELAGGLREQLAAWRVALDGGAARVGWKIGLNIPEVQRRLGLREPVIGHLTTATALVDGASYDATGAEHLRAECEIALRVGADGAVDGWAAAIELVDVGRPPAGAAGIVAGNVFHRAFAVGPFATEPPRGTGALAIDGELHAAEQPPPDPAATLDVVARQLAGAGEELRPGDVILSGALVHVAVAAGVAVRAQIDGLGPVEVSIA